MPRLTTFMDEPWRWGCIAIIAHPRPSAPHLPFRVEETEISPEERYGKLVRVHDPKLAGTELIPCDWIMHLSTGVVARVVERIDQHTCRIEAMSTPEGEAGERAWVVTEGKGEWVVIGVAYKTWDEAPSHLRPPTELSPGEYRKEMFRHPERLPWAQAGFKVGRNWGQMNRKERKRIRAQMRKLLGMQSTVKALGDVDAAIQKHAYHEKKLDAGTLISWNPAHNTE